jgi:hypothetical protein
VLEPFNDADTGVRGLVVLKNSPVKTFAGTSISELEVLVRVTCNVLPDRLNKAEALRLPFDPEYVIDKAWLELVHTRATNIAQSAENMDRMPFILPMLKNPPRETINHPFSCVFVCVSAYITYYLYTSTISDLNQYAFCLLVLVLSPLALHTVLLFSRFLTLAMESKQNLCHACMHSPVTALAVMHTKRPLQNHWLPNNVYADLKNTAAITFIM